MAVDGKLRTAGSESCPDPTPVLELHGVRFQSMIATNYREKRKIRILLGVSLSLILLLWDVLPDGFKRQQIIG